MPLDLKIGAGLLASIVAAVSFALYVRATFRRETKPNRATWWILTVVGFMLTGSYYSLGARHTMWLALTYFLFPCIIALVSLKLGEGGWTHFDRMCLVVAGLSAALWWLTRSPLVALMINLLIDFVGLLPTIRKSYLRPASEDRLAWTLGAVASAINLVAIDPWSFPIIAYPIYMVAGNGLIAALLYLPRRENKAIVQDPARP